MTSATTGRDFAESASDIVERFRIDLSAAALKRICAEQSSAEFLNSLLEAESYRDARHFLAHALPKRRALWWACLCAWDVAVLDSHAEQPALTEAIETVVQFIRVPSEANRRAAEAVYRSQAKASLAAMLAGAAYFSAGSIAPIDAATPVPAPLHVTGRLVSTAVYLTATMKDIQRYKLVMRDYVLLGQQIARGESLWPMREKERDRLQRWDSGGRDHALAGPHALQPSNAVKVGNLCSRSGCQCGATQ